jgi:hypothetical protein
MVRMPPEIPRWKERTGNQAFSVARRKKDHEPRYLAALDRLELRHNELMVPS